MNDHPTSSSGTALASARRTLQIESQGLQDLSARLDDSFTRVVDLLLACRGRVVVSGIGKTGHIARKIAATLASTGTPAFFVHAAEAVHGDLGMITRDDVLIAISYSGSGSELLTILPVVRRMGAGLVAITGNPQSELARQADIHLDASVAQEACPMNLAPTASTTAALALGDALAVACLEARGFGPQDFARSHPGGALGRRLLTHVRDVMRQGDALPIVMAGTPVSQALEVMSAKGMGMTVVTDAQHRPLGIFTDGDLRRLIARHGDIRSLTVEAGMTRSPRSINPEALAVEAARQMDEQRLNHMLVLDNDGALVGALHMHDLMAAKVV
ncbi:KpsF/GutQ family sugar-phosphate isomerase [Achromobacter mucicolens]|jgi:arabinose-5-phosphate isomerase|uniref:KpsF/GutQ family sugar-phosphate isomerase n=1 Tax=Achromobacter TaxID=222 RepID=UPI00070169FC|nr:MULTISPECIES: KpsF/GutQ family sugar-phosphate isomerase [Achromobacter]OXC88539.1 KpsF/GutQ family sugar-phosphate isomerase [Achromobacter sp. KAs 3-5]KRB15815.1 D-arabinose 5-phosphate isomerase [Achromobacter sp. Root170]MDF2862385.1 arabinose 5-phosphate isomerase [Achromobacter mucicolens]MDH1524730.1 KpsF/GutQ family sugar-phosphate isomerase [Achromobacter mucicolens]OXC88911.1 KpsF/GutQ family sugar-phosphate isomerase [Achromobacter sp. KAs 3-5]